MRSSALSWPHAIVVGIDFRAASDEALRQAATLAARADGVMLHAAHCLEPPARSTLLPVLAEEIERARARLASRVEAHVPDAALRAITLHVRVGAPPAALVQLAADVNADLLVIGGRAHDHHTHHLFAPPSVEQRLLRTARCPLLVARPTEHVGAEARSPSIDPPCADCLETRRASRGDRWWCERHATPHVRAHTYGYARAIPFAEHDSEVVPTGRGFSR